MNAILDSKHTLVGKINQSVPVIRDCDPIDVIASELADSLPLVKPPSGDRRKWRVAAVQSVQRSFGELGKRVDDMNKLFAAAVASSIRPADRDFTSFKIRDEKVLEELQGLSKLRLELPDILRAELMAREDTEVHSLMKSALEHACSRFMDQVRQQLRSMQKQSLCGEIVWHGPDVCQYHYFEQCRALKSQSQLSTRYERKDSVTEIYQGIWTDYEIINKKVTWDQYDLRRRVEHHLFNAKRHQFPAKAVRWPKHLYPIFRAVPSWIAPHIFVAEGDMLRETFDDSVTRKSWSKESEVSRKVIATGVNYSPAVTLGDVVLVGWSKADL